MNKRILVIGSNGQLGQALAKLASQYPHLSFVHTTRKVLDLSQTQLITDYFKDKDFNIIINCAAYTAVDNAETESELADQINHRAVKQLAEIAKQKNMTLIHISTDYVFNGENFKPYVETDKTDPQNVYGITKLKGEQAIQQLSPKSIIIRTSWVYSEFGNNFVKTMLRLGQERDSLNIIFDQIGSPTYAGDLAKAILDIILHKDFDKKSQIPSLYHYSNEGVCSWYDFAKAIFEISKIHCKVNPIETRDYPTPAKRPYYSLMNKSQIKQDYGLDIPYWKDSVRICHDYLNESDNA